MPTLIPECSQENFWLGWEDEQIENVVQIILFEESKLLQKGCEKKGNGHSLIDYYLFRNKSRLKLKLILFFF